MNRRELLKFTLLAPLVGLFKKKSGTRKLSAKEISNSIDESGERLRNSFLARLAMAKKYRQEVFCIYVNWAAFRYFVKNRDINKSHPGSMALGTFHKIPVYIHKHLNDDFIFPLGQVKCSQLSKEYANDENFQLEAVDIRGLL